MSENTLHKIAIVFCWIFFFPIMLSVAILKNESWSSFTRWLLVGLFWLFCLILVKML